MSTVTDENVDAVRGFLEANAETAMFLLSNLDSYGFTLGPSMSSGNIHCIQSNGEICGVFSLTRRGTLLSETAGRTEFASVILEACAGEPIAIQGTIGEWHSACALWQLLLDSNQLVEQFRSQELLCRMDLPASQRPAGVFPSVRQLLPSDFSQWLPHITAFLTEEGLPIQGTLEQRKANFEENVGKGRWWGSFDNGRLVSTASLNAVYRGLGQVGGVYTAPSHRRRGLARTMMRALLHDCVRLHDLRRLILFTGQKNQFARALYDSLGFLHVGQFALLFGTSPASRS
ncbi:MAG TPA: GNAT family N-acetyltransferase [Polyangiaceae bacterium]|nr:GNAT family N-acetyltransferase [Polyangiaceae bacterium]